MAGTKQNLVVDDDEALRRELAEGLELYEGFQVTQAGDGKSALTLAGQQPYAVIRLDVGLPDVDGRELCKLMRRQRITAPVIMLIALGADADTILGLEAGANDYVAKPFRLSVLLAHIRAHLRQSKLSDDVTFAIGPYRFRPSAKMLVDLETNRKVHLTGKETAILNYLYRMNERPVPREVLLDEVWATTPASRPTRSRPTSTACARRSSPTRPTPGSSSPSPAATR